MALPQWPNPDQAALLLLRLLQAKRAKREKELTRVRLAEVTLRRLWGRARLTEPFIGDVAERLFAAGWVFFFAGTTYAAVKQTAVEAWPRASSRIIASEIEAALSGQLDYSTLEHLLTRSPKAQEVEPAEAEVD